MLGNLFGAPNRETFATSLLNAIRRAGDHRPIRFDRDRFCLFVEEERGTLSLTAAYDEFVAAPGRERRGVIERYVGVWLQGGEPEGPPDSLAETRDHLFPRVRERIHFERLRLERGRDLAFRLLSPDLGVELVVERPDRPGEPWSVSLENLDEWEVSFEEALRVARANLVQRGSGTFRSPQPGFFLSNHHDGYDATRLLLAETLVGLAVKGSLVALAPRPGYLALTGSEDSAGLARLVEMAHHAMDHADLLSPAPVVWSQGAWQPFQPEPGYPQHEPVRRLWLTATGRNYTVQAPLLADHHPDAVVAPFELARNPQDDSWVSYCTWSDETAHLLPGATTVALVRDGRSLGFFTWEVVQEHCSDLLEPLAYHPLRWRTLGFPDANRISLMR